jgi:hypothetical protein
MWVRLMAKAVGSVVAISFMRHDGLYFLNDHSQSVFCIAARGTECELAPWDFTVATAFNHDWVNFIPPRMYAFAINVARLVSDSAKSFRQPGSFFTS